MPPLASLAWRTLAARPVRTLLTVVGIALGVAVLNAGLLTNVGIERSIDQTVDDVVGRADLRVAALDGAGLSDAAVAAVRSIPGVAVAAPTIERRTFLAAGGPTTADALPPAVTVVGIDPAIDPAVHDLPLAAGSRLSDPNASDALVTERLADETAVRIGDVLKIDGSVDAKPADLRFRIVGIVAGDGPYAESAGRTMVVPLAAAERAFTPIGVSHVDLALSPDATADAVSAGIAERLTSEPYVLSSPDELAAGLRSSAAEFQATTALVAAVALFAGAFLIFNTLSMTVAERVREVGLLRAAGASRRQVVAIVLGSATILGVIGSAAGIGLGWAIATAMAVRVGEIGGIRLGDVQPSADATLLAVVGGLAVTLAAAFEPAVRASRVPPVDALRPTAAPVSASRSSARWLATVFVVVGVTGLLLRPAAGGADALLRGAAAFAILLVLALAVQLLLAPLGRLAGAPFALLLRTEERLARGALVRDRARAGLTVAALAVGLATLVALGAAAADARGDATAWIGGVVPGDLVATSVTPRPLGEGVGAQLAASPRVARVTPLATFDVAYRGVRLDAAAVVGGDLLADGRLSFADGDRRAALSGLDAGGAVLLPRSVAERLGLRLGDAMSFPVGNGRSVEERVAGIVERSLPGSAGEAILVGWNDATTGFGVAGADAFAVRFAPDASAEDRASFTTLAESIGLQPTSLAAVEGAVGDALGRVLGVFDALAAVAVLIGGLGIANTLSMSVLERVRELGVLRAAGMTRRQVWRMVAVEAGIVGIVGAAVGVAGGVLAGTLMRAAASPAGGGISLPWPSIGLAIVLGLVVSMLAAAYPAWLAGRQSIVRAVRAE